MRNNNERLYMSILNEKKERVGKQKIILMIQRKTDETKKKEEIIMI